MACETWQKLGWDLRKKVKGPYPDPFPGRPKSSYFRQPRGLNIESEAVHDVEVLFEVVEALHHTLCREP